MRREFSETGISRAKKILLPCPKLLSRVPSLCLGLCNPKRTRHNPNKDFPKMSSSTSSPSFSPTLMNTIATNDDGGMSNSDNYTNLLFISISSLCIICFLMSCSCYRYYLKRVEEGRRGGLGYYDVGRLVG